MTGKNLASVQIMPGEFMDAFFWRAFEAPPDAGSR